MPTLYNLYFLACFVSYNLHIFVFFSKIRKRRMDMERLALDDLVKWNASKRRTPLLIYGARQVGKSFLVEDLFAKKYYKDNYIYIDFKKENEVRNYILAGGNESSSIVDAKKIVSYLELRFNRKIDESTLLIFDEVQECLPIITSLKYFKQDLPNIPVIATGSMVRIKIKRQQNIDKQHKKHGFFFPVGGITRLFVYPLSFDEFLLNQNKKLYEKIVDSYNKKEPLEDYIHDMAMDALYNFLLVGGMPEATNIYLEEKDILSSREKLINIFSDYLSDMELYQASEESIIRSKAIFESIYSQLEKESKNFKGSFVEKGLRNRDIRSPKDYLTLANIVYESKQIKEHVSFPLKEENENDYRLYLLDNGLFCLQSKINMATFVDKEARNTLSGVLFENYIATEFVSKGIPLFYWKGKSSSEFEFMVSSNNEIYPVDAKKGKGTLGSLKKYRESNKCNLAIKISSNKYGYDKENKILTIPLYQVFMLANDIKNETFKLD